MDGPKIRRLYYSVGEIAKIADVNPRVVRIWERKFPSFRPSKSKTGRRLFRPEDLDLIRLIKRFKEYGYTDKKISDLLQGTNREKLSREKLSQSKRDSEKLSLISEIKKGLEDILNLLEEIEPDRSNSVF